MEDKKEEPEILDLPRPEDVRLCAFLLWVLDKENERKKLH